MCGFEVGRRIQALQSFGKDGSGQVHFLREDSIEGLTSAGKEWMYEL